VPMGVNRRVDIEMLRGEARRRNDERLDAGERSAHVKCASCIGQRTELHCATRATSCNGANGCRFYAFPLC
jgi:hypothetical protein